MKTIFSNYNTVEAMCNDYLLFDARNVTTSFITKIKVKLNLQHKYINTKRGNIYSE